MSYIAHFRGSRFHRFATSVVAERRTPFFGQCDTSDQEQTCYAYRNVGTAQMFSEHFRDELIAQMARATARGAKNILINSRELHCSLGDPGPYHHATAGCEAMETEMKTGDI